MHSKFAVCKNISITGGSLFLGYVQPEEKQQFEYIFPHWKILYFMHFVGVSVLSGFSLQ